ncbi:sigma 54-interacting transcriptional regulator [Pseudomonas sp. GL-B-16]|uniref:sigma 54-interacting transcriptional regulator n=1 Tax=Pseudomonas sp. GL-B-16 TaxID=2832373 RepID=UPI001CBF403A|nr:sigma 54-interacting transcriptional regulator [Pseudomonas sp. GL-B-16]
MFNYDRVVTDLLVYGETGTGKDVLAKHIHDSSGRRGAFIGINCAAIPEGLAEGQLFGVVSGAFTGATRTRQGYIEASNGGTLYLDEIDSMPLSLQAKFLRILETRGVERLGSTNFVPLDLHVIASTQSSLSGMVEEGKFRRDLLFRLNMITIKLPALRSQRERILPLFEQFTKDLAAEMNRPVAAVLDNHLTQLLLSHGWPGNIRELKSAAKRFVLGLPLLGCGLGETHCQQYQSGLKWQLKVIERRLIQDALKRHKQSLDRVVEELDIPKRTLYHRMKELGI